MITTEEFLQKLCEKTANGLSNTSICIDCNVIDLATQDAKPITSVALQKPVVSVERHGLYVQVDFKFISALDNDLRLMWNTLELYGKTSNDININTEQTGLLAVCGITMIPMFYDGQYFCSAVNPLFWALTAEEVGKNANVIRVLFNAEDFQIFENLDIDTDQLKKEVRQEIAYENRMNAEFTQRANAQETEDEY